MPVAIVTGASSGIGASTARNLAARGFDIGITYAANEAGARRTARDVENQGRRAVLAPLDLRHPTSATAVITGFADQLGGLDVLVNGAGYSPRLPALDDPHGPTTLLDVVNVNLVGPAICAIAAARQMSRRGTTGRIVNVSSVVADQPVAGGSAYCAAKAGLDALTRAYALEWAGRGIVVVSVAPGHTATPMTGVAEIHADTDLTRPVIPLGRAAHPDEIAALIAYYAVDAPPYVTGSRVLADGGLSLVSGPETLRAQTGR